MRGGELYMTDNKDMEFKADLLNTVINVIQGHQGQNTNELISLLALSNLLGIISFLNTQDINFNTRNSASNAATPELKDLASNLLGSMGGAGDKKVNPAMLLNVMKNLSNIESPEGNKSEGKSAEGNDKNRA